MNLHRWKSVLNSLKLKLIVLFQVKYRCGVNLCRWESPECTRLIGTRAHEGEIGWMPSARNDFVVVSGYAHSGQRLAEVTLQVSQDEPVVVASTQQVVSVRREPYGSDILRAGIRNLIWQRRAGERMIFIHLCVRFKGLYDPATSDIIKDAGGVLMTGD